MNEKCCMLMVFLSLCGAAGGAWAEAAKKSSVPHWLHDLDEGRKRARATDKPLFVVFRCEH